MSTTQAVAASYPVSTPLPLGVPQALPLLVLHSVAGALAGAAIMGLLGGLCTAAYVDLIIRSAPRGLEGPTLMMSLALYYVAIRFGDVLGTYIYEHLGGFPVCVVATTVVYLLIIPVLYEVPRRLTATADGELPQGGY